MRVLGVDPGLASTGWGVVDSNGRKLKYVAQGTIKTHSKTPTPLRLKDIHQQILMLVEQFKPESLSLETLFFSKNITSALPVAQARGVVILAGALAGLPVAEFSPNEIKQAVVGNGRADKKQVESMVRLMLGKIEGKTSDHSMDALASAICSIHQGSFHV